MRVGVDLLPLQSEGSRGRGVGRYASRLIEALVARGPRDEFVLFHYLGLPEIASPLRDAPNAELISLDASGGRGPIRDQWLDLTASNPLDLDVLVIPNPFELTPTYEPPPQPLGRPAMVAVLHDFIPLLFPDAYLCDPRESRRYHEKLSNLIRYKLFLTNSEATRGDAIRLLNLRGDRVVHVGGAVEHRFRSPGAASGRSGRRAPATEAAPAGEEPLVLHVGGMDDRKNVRSVIDAFAGLSPAWRDRAALVIVGHYDDSHTSLIERRAEDAGIARRLRLLGAVGDDRLAELYQRCAAFVFPSLYEGLGLPILEAMASGAVVIAGRNSAQVEVVGDAGFLVDPLDVAGITRCIEMVLDDREAADAIGRRAVERATRLDWSDVGSTARSAILGVHLSRRTGSGPPGAPPAPRRRLAMVSPFPPKRTGIADYSARLCRELAAQFRVELFHDGDYVPDEGLGHRPARCYDRRLLSRRRSALDYAAVIHQMGNSWYHRSVYESMREAPGITVLHDFCLAGFHYWYARQPDVAPGHFEGVMRRELREDSESLLSELASWEEEDGGVQAAANRRGIHLNRDVFERSRRVVVHSEWCRDEVRRCMPEMLDRTVVIPLGADLNVPSRARREETRSAFGLPGDALIFGCLGNLTGAKMYEEILAAFAEVSGRVEDALLLFVGKDWEDGRARELAGTAGVSERTRFLGHVARHDFERLAAIVDVGVCLRRPPTFGETSASLLDFLRSGVATIVTDVATFSDYPDEVVCKWDPVRHGVEGLSELMAHLAEAPMRREELSRAAIEHVRSRHDWRTIAGRYASLIRSLGRAGAWPGRQAS